MTEYIENIFPRKIEDFPESKDYLINSMSVEDVLVFREFRDRFKTWEQLKAERYLC